MGRWNFVCLLVWFDDFVDLLCKLIEMEGGVCECDEWRGRGMRKGGLFIRNFDGFTIGEKTCINYILFHVDDV